MLLSHIFHIFSPLIWPKLKMMMISAVFLCMLGIQRRYSEINFHSENILKMTMHLLCKHLQCTLCIEQTCRPQAQSQIGCCRHYTIFALVAALLSVGRATCEPSLIILPQATGVPPKTQLVLHHHLRFTPSWSVCSALSFIVFQIVISQPWQLYENKWVLFVKKLEFAVWKTRTKLNIVCDVSFSRLVVSSAQFNSNAVRLI